MAIRLRRQRDGQSWRPFWYGDFAVDGKTKTVNLNVKWKGVPPDSMRGSGDVEFERSRAKAEAELQRMVDEVQSKGRSEHLTERLIRSKTGKSVEYVKIADLADRWRKMERQAVPSERHLAGCDAVFLIFESFMQKNNPAATFLYEINKTEAAAWLRELQGRYSAKTASEYHQLVRSAVSRFLPTGCESPFTDIARGRKSKDETIHRQPFTADELQRLLEAAKTDDFLYPLVATAACTGMRRGDVCKLRWDSINLTEGVLTVKTSKSGANVEIPIFPPLRTVFEARGGAGEGYVFPEAAAMLEANPTGLSWRFKTLVANALADKKTAPLPAAVSASSIVSEAVEAINSNTADGARRCRILENFRRYADGQSLRDIEKDTGVARGVVSTDLAEVERWIGKRFKRSTPGRHSTGPSRSIKDAINSTTRIGARIGRCNAGSIRDWHALRATWVTLALSAGVPMELVRRVTGHATVEVVLQHYFRPGREQFRTILTDAMPDVLTGGKPVKAIDEGESSGGEMADLLTKIQNGTATTADKKRFKALAAKV